MIRIKKESKRGWIRIVEAFIGVLLVMGVILTLITRQKASFAMQENEIINLQSSLLDSISRDSQLRSQVLSNNLQGVNERVSKFLPAGMSFHAQICNYNDLCALEVPIYEKVYAQEVLIAANLTYYNPASVKKLKIFFWQGPWPENFCQSVCNAGSRRCFDETRFQTCVDADASPDRQCWNWSAAEVCGQGETCDEGACVAEQVEPEPGVAVLDVTFISGNAYDWVYNSVPVKRINWTITVRETAGVDWYFDSGIECWLIKPVDWTSNCKTTLITDGRKATKTQPYTRDSYQYTDESGNIYNLTYTGHDALNNQINTSTYTINFPTF